MPLIIEKNVLAIIFSNAFTYLQVKQIKKDAATFRHFVKIIKKKQQQGRTFLRLHNFTYTPVLITIMCFLLSVRDNGIPAYLIFTFNYFYSDFCASHKSSF